MKDTFLTQNKEYLEGYFSAKSGQRYDHNPYLSYRDIIKFKDWKNGFEDFQNGIRILEFENMEKE